MDVEHRPHQSHAGILRADLARANVARPQPQRLVGHAKDFSDRIEFTYSILDGDEVIGCVYIHPTTTAGYGAEVRSWVTEDRRDMDVLVWQSLSEWIGERWPFQAVLYAPRDEV